MEQKVTIEMNPDTARALGRKRNGALHAFLTNYRNSWLRLGFTEQDLADGGSDRFIDAISIGDANAVKRQLRAHFEAGADQVCIFIRPTMKVDSC